MQRLLYLFLSVHCSTRFRRPSAHHQEHKTVHTASGIVKPILLPGAVWQYLTLYVRFCAPGGGWRNRLKRVEQFIEIHRLRKTLHLVGCTSEIDSRCTDLWTSKKISGLSLTQFGSVLIFYQHSWNSILVMVAKVTETCRWLIIRINSQIKSNKMQQFIKIFISYFMWGSTSFGRHITHHQEPKTALAASGFAYVEGYWTWSCWTLSSCVQEEAWIVGKPDLDVAPRQCTCSCGTPHPQLSNKTSDICCAPSTLFSGLSPSRLFCFLNLKPLWRVIISKP
jgi:hypothetical protein